MLGVTHSVGDSAAEDIQGPAVQADRGNGTDVWGDRL